MRKAIFVAPTRSWRIQGLFYTLVLGVLAFLVLYPLFLLLLSSFQSSLPGEATRFSLESWRLALAEPGMGDAIINTFTLALARLLIVFPIAVFFAWLLARTDIPGREWLEFLFWIGFFLPSLAVVQGWTAQAGLTLHETKTRIVDANESGFEFPGYRFERGSRWPRETSLRRFTETIRSKTRRTNGHSLTTIISDVNRTTVGWFAYFKHSRGWTFTRLDAWIRMRLRSVLRKRQGRRGRGRGADPQRWPNAYFSARGRFSMATAHSAAGQSARR